MSRPSILTLDLSLTCTGFCRDGETGRLCYPQLRGWQRIAELTEAIGNLATDIDVVVLEGYSYASQGRSVYQIGELGGIVRFWIWGRQTPLVDVPPACLKRYATGKGNAPKDAMIAAAIRRFGFEGSDNNEADAFLLWCMASHAYGAPVTKVTQVQAASLEAVMWPVLCAVAS